MKTMKLTLALFVALMMVTSIPVLAFHNGSQLVCDNCHTMHYSEGGQAPPTQAKGYPQNADSGGPFEHLLVKSNITDLCLQCHKDNGYTGAPSVYNTNPASASVLLPGGDFGYSAKIPQATLPGLTSGGHNPFGSPGAQQSVNFNPSPDGGATGLTPPGSSTTMSSFQCTDCHGVHGPESGNVSVSRLATYQNYGYRLLLAEPLGNNTLVSTDSIISRAWIVSGGAVVAGPDGANLQQSESATNINVYKGGFSEWCSSCHANFHAEVDQTANDWDGTAYIRHPTNSVLTSLRAYATGSTYDYNYPLVQGNGTWTNTGGGTLGNTDKIQCLTCHKAHATAYPNALRWDPTQASALGQCNKCHEVGGGI